MMIFHSHFYSAETNTFFSTANNKLSYVLNMCSWNNYSKINYSTI